MTTGWTCATVEGTGRGGLITRQDVERRIASVPHADRPRPRSGRDVVTAGERRTPLNGFRKAVSAALSRSRSEIPEATVWVDVDATALVAAARERCGPRPTRVRDCSPTSPGSSSPR